MTPTPRHPLVVRAPAKINLHLGVGAPREDGFHPLDTVYQAISLYDDLTVRAAPEGGSEPRLTMRAADHVDLATITPGDNIALAALRLLERHHRRPLTLDVHIDKSIPVAGGMAGGSADAAAALIAVDRWHDLHTPDDVLLGLASELGSDVPFALVGGTAHGTGRGERVAAVPDAGSWWWVVVPASGAGLPTPLVYRHFDTMRPDAPAEPPPATDLLAALATGEPVRLARTLHNDLQEPAIDLRPELGDLIERGEAEGALRGLVSGSGPTVLFLCDSGDGAGEVAAGLRGGGHEVVLIAHGPVAGAHLVT